MPRAKGSHVWDAEARLQTAVIYCLSKEGQAPPRMRGARARATSRLRSAKATRDPSQGILPGSARAVGNPSAPTMPEG